ncbi:hypothetical protein BCT54_07985 [Vibrio splendidus]|uniref:Uncharacterized protein n=1 Tax=Vibrio splendidus TaxID=29497 RepID=A0A2N7JM58_VIBSP|nr:hypothetical protein BCT54_07985 [Vibrio splendidus]
MLVPHLSNVAYNLIVKHCFYIQLFWRILIWQFEIENAAATILEEDGSLGDLSATKTFVSIKF